MHLFLLQLIQVLIGALIKLGQRLTGRTPVPVRVRAPRTTLLPRPSSEMARPYPDPSYRFRP